MSAFNPFLRVVSDMMRRYGGDGVLTTSANGTYDPETSSMTPVITKYPIRAMLFDYVPRQDGMGTVSRGLVQTGDKQLLVKTEAGVPCPAANDKITFGGITYSVVVSKDMNPSGVESIYYEVYLRI